jgi:phage recombination protein Bet
MADTAGMMETLKATAFKGNVSDNQMTALLLIANQYGLNPWTREIYAFPDQNNGIVPVVGVDGWSRIMNEHPMLDGMDFVQDEESCTCIIYRKDRAHPVKVTEYLSECKRSAKPWQTHPKRMLRHKAMIQCARLASGYIGIFDQDEAERILENDATPSVKQTRSPAAAAAQNQTIDIADFESEQLEAMREAALNGEAALKAARDKLPQNGFLKAFWAKHGASLKDAATKAQVIESAPVVDPETGEVVA